MSSPSIAVRQLDVNHQPVYGNGKNNFLYDIDAVAQIIQTRLLLFLGEWWKNLQDGLPLFQSILGIGGAGKSGAAAVEQLIIARIRGTRFVQGVTDVQISYYPNTRSFSFSCNVQTQFGNLGVVVTPGMSAIING